MEDVGLGMSLDELGLRTPFFVLSYSSCFSTPTTSFHLRVAFSSPEPSSSALAGRWCSAFESLCKVTWSVVRRVHSNMFEGDTSLFDRISAIWCYEERSLAYLKDWDDPSWNDVQRSSIHPKDYN